MNDFLWVVSILTMINKITFYNYTSNPLLWFCLTHNELKDYRSLTVLYLTAVRLEGLSIVLVPVEVRNHQLILFEESVSHLAIRSPLLAVTISQILLVFDDLDHCEESCSGILWVSLLLKCIWCFPDDQSVAMIGEGNQRGNAPVSSHHMPGCKQSMWHYCWY